MDSKSSGADRCDHYYFSDLRARDFGPERRSVHGSSGSAEEDRKRRRPRGCGTCLSRVNSLESYLRCCFRPVTHDPRIQKRPVRSPTSPRSVGIEDLQLLLEEHAPELRSLISAQELLYGGILPLWRYVKSGCESGVEAEIVHAPEMEDREDLMKHAERGIKSLVRVLEKLEDDSHLETKITALCNIEPDFPLRRNDLPWIRSRLDCCLSRLDDAARVLADRYYCAEENDAPGSIWMGAVSIGEGFSVIRPRLMFPDFPEGEGKTELLPIWFGICACIKWGIDLECAKHEDLAARCTRIRDSLLEKALSLRIFDMGSDAEESETSGSRLFDSW